MTQLTNIRTGAGVGVGVAAAVLAFGVLASVGGCSGKSAVHLDPPASGGATAQPGSSHPAGIFWETPDVDASAMTAAYQAGLCPSSDEHWGSYTTQGQVLPTVTASPGNRISLLPPGTDKLMLCVYNHGPQANIGEYRSFPGLDDTPGSYGAAIIDDLGQVTAASPASACSGPMTVYVFAGHGDEFTVIPAAWGNDCTTIGGWQYADYSKTNFTRDLSKMLALNEAGTKPNVSPTG